MKPTRAAAAALSLPVAGLVLSLAGSAHAGSTPKKGVGTWSFNGESPAMASVGATWWYTWATGPGSNTVPSTVSFVPMLWGSGSVTTGSLNQVKTEGSVLLGFNEPDNAGQSNLTPAQALALWPQLVATGMRLGSPAVAANAQKVGGWLDTFMSGASTMGLRVDFICLHWYGGDFNPTSAVTELKSYVDQTHTKYNLPIWVTEFALTNFSGGVSYPTETEQAQFAAGAVDMLEAEPYVERYAWFALPPCDATGGSSCASGNTRPLSLDGGALTAVGIAYAGAGPDGGGIPADAGGATDATTGGDAQGSTGSPDGGGGVDGTTPGSSGGGGVSSGGGGASSNGGGGGASSSSGAGGSSGAGEGDASSGASGSGGGCNCEVVGVSGGSRGSRSGSQRGAVFAGALAMAALTLRSSRKARASRTSRGAPRPGRG